MILGGTACRLAKVRRLTSKPVNAWSPVIEAVLLMSVVLIVVMQYRLSVRFFRQPIANVIALAWAMIAYGTQVFKQRTLRQS